MRPLLSKIIILLSLWPYLSVFGANEELNFSDGELHVSTANFADREILDLVGGWRYFPQEILDEKASCPKSNHEALPLIANWWNDRLSESAEANGLNSFCLTVHNPDRLSLSLWWPDRIRFDFYANGRLLEGRGQLKDKRDMGASDRQSNVIPLPDTELLTLVVHTDNTFMSWRKTKDPIYIGLTPAIHSRFSMHIVFQACLLGGLLMTGLYQLALFLLHRESRETLYLGLFCLLVGLRSASLGRSNIHSLVAPGFLGPWNYALPFICYFLSAACFYQFLRINYPRWTSAYLSRVVWFLAIVLSIVCLAFGPKSYNAALLIFHGPALLGMVSAPYLVLQAVRYRQRGSWVVFIGTLLLCIGAIHDMFRSQGYGLNFDLLDGSLLCLVFIASLLISIRFVHAFEILSHLSHELSKIVPIHVIKKLKKGERLENTMPAGEAEAVILVFDVVGSSRVETAGFRECLDLCLARFFNLLNENYDAEKRQATGYRLKELGDGLICSIGFPYPVPGNQSMEQTAVALAERFCSIFTAETSRLPLKTPIYCGIGLAKGKVEGFFPRSGQKQYDLRGSPLTMATRYEAMRNLVYRHHGVQGSVIFIQDAVYQGLSEQQKSSFQAWDAQAPQQRIRDDEGAERAWFKFYNTVDSPSAKSPSVK